ncbi:amino acid adenylation domain-containing protein [Paenibacillus campi]|uniref:amino acid adenylation domain-containing protein n=1 Tax=Paenibacillus campi TaxID=3106031 RepID=UPI002AFDD2FC|nr:amino acid adenylation domain-containing protein [Paenibacillus sp. SGZ-1014]
MRTIELLEQLKKHNIKFWLQNDELYYEGQLPDRLKTDFVEHKQHILHALQKIEHKNNRSSIQSYPKPSRIPLSFAQYRLWFIEQLQPGDTSYNIQDARRITGKLHIEMLHQALYEIILRQESLRTTFHEHEGEPFQQINNDVHYATQLIDLREMDKHEQEQMIKKVIKEDLFKPFDFTDCLFRITIMQLNELEHILIMSMHHIISDGWSMGILFKELQFYYRFFEEHVTEPLPPLNIQYADYALWEQEQLKHKQLEQKLNFWKDHLQHAPGLIELPHDLPRKTNVKSKGASYTFVLPEQLSTSLEHICKQQHATIFMGLFALYNVLLYRYTQQKDLIVGTITANRELAEIENIIGFFVNTLPIRTEVKEDSSFTQLLEQVRDACLQAYNHQEVPFEMIVDEINPDRNLSYTPLIQTICIMQNQTVQGDLSLSKLQVEPIEIEYDLIKFDLSLVFSKSANLISCYVGYNKQLFTEHRIKEMMDSFIHLLGAIIRNSDQTISKLAMMSEQQRATLIKRGQAQIKRTDNICIHEWFEQQVHQNPSHTAVKFEHEQLTYADLNKRANRLAHFIIEQGSLPGEKIGICLERSLDMIISILAVLKAGGTYVPIDPRYPEQRKQYIVDDSQIKTLITSSAMEQASLHASIHCIFVEAECIQQQTSDNMAIPIASDQLAYIIYTSGTTGNPKGVMISHANVVRLFQSTEHWFQFNDQDKWTQFHSFAFDFSVWEIWGALFYGGQLVIVPYWISRSTDEFYQLVVSEQITVLNQTPSAFYQFIKAEADRQHTLHLRYVVFGGEALEPQRLHEWLEKHGDRQPKLINMYGITETTVHVTYRQICKNDNQHSMIGEKIPDLELYVLDPFLEPVLPGVTGEMYVGGAGVAQGYLNLPDLTGQKFVAHPFATPRNDHERLYRTGDLARYNNEYDLEYRGRQDDQVKIRGYRIELGEIQRNLESHHAVLQSLITVYENVQGDKGLVAYYTVNNNAMVTEEQLKMYLKSILPSHFIPDWFMEVNEFVLNQNGKIDKKSLPTLQNKQTTAKHIVEPTTSTEMMMQSIWMNILGIERIGTLDNFFDMGGNSFNAVRLIRRIEKECNVRLPISFIFQFPTIYDMSLAIDQKMTGSTKDILVQFQQGASNSVLSFVHPIGGNLFCYQQLITLLPDRMTIYGFEAPGLHDHQAAISSIQQLAETYNNELISRQSEHSTLVGWSMGGVIAYEMGLQLYYKTGIAPPIIMIDCWSSNMGSPAISQQAALRHFGEDLLRSLKIRVSVKQLEEIAMEAEPFQQWVNMIKHNKEGFSDIDTEQLKNRFKIYTANLQALSTYKPMQKYPGHITLLRADAVANGDDTLGWADWSEHDVNVISIRGDHYTILEEPGLSQIARSIKEYSSEF